MRDNKNSTVFKCRHIIEVDGKKKECTGNFTLQSDRKTFKAKAHQHDRMEPIQSEIMVILYKENASAVGLELKPKFISCDFEKGAIKAFKHHFPGVKIGIFCRHLDQ
jgi:hypothetical protein